MRQPYNVPCKKCGSINQTLMISDSRKSIFCSNCNNFEDIYVSDEIKQKWENEAKLEEQSKINTEIRTDINIPKCPICQSTNLKKITFTKRAVKTAVFGAVGAIDDAGKTYRCENCGSKF